MKYDMAVIGGGLAGMMAAGRAGELGTRVVLLEKNPKSGKAPNNRKRQAQSHESIR